MDQDQATLPDDILYMVCQEVGERKDLGTLYNLSRSCRRLANPALVNLYRTFESAPFPCRGSDEIEVGEASKPRPKKAEKDSIRRWALLWRSVILSSLGKTMIPYCRHIRTLDFRDLNELLDDARFDAPCRDFFFAGDMSRFRFEKQPPPIIAKLVPARLEVEKIINAVGNQLTETTPLVADLAGDLPGETLQIWLPRLPRLTDLTLWSGSSLAKLGSVLASHCTALRALRFYSWYSETADEELAVLLSEIRPQLSAFEVFSYSNIGLLAFPALALHHQTLTELKLPDLDEATISFLGSLASLTALTTLYLGEQPSSGPEGDEEDCGIPEIVAWLRQCKNLRIVGFKDMYYALHILRSVLPNGDIRLVKLEVNDDFHEAEDAVIEDFLHALHNQSALERLIICKTNASHGPDLGGALTKLSQLRSLCLVGISDFFGYNDIILLAESLPRLENLAISGWCCDDIVLPTLAKLSQLRRLEICSRGSFTAAGLLQFVAALRPTQTGFLLAITVVSSKTPLSEADQTAVADELDRRVAGRFEYAIAQEVDSDADPSGSSDWE